MIIISNSFVTACRLLLSKYTISTLQSIDSADNQHSYGCIWKFTRFLIAKKERWVNAFPKSHSDIAAAENRLDLSLAASSDHSQSANLWIIFYSTKFPLKNERKNDL